MAEGALEFGEEEVVLEGGVAVDLTEAVEVAADGALGDVAEVRDLLT